MREGMLEEGCFPGPIFVHTAHYNFYVEIHVDSSESVGTIKSKIQDEYETFPSEQQRLTFDGQVLEDDRTLASYDIVPGSNLHLLKRFPGQIVVYVSNADKFAIQVDNDQESVNAIKRKIPDRIPAPWTLKFRDSELEDGNLLASYDIEQNSTLALNGEISVKTLTGKTITFEVNATEEIAMLNDKIHDREGTHPA